MRFPRVDTLFLTLAGPPAAPMVIPRRLGLRLAPGRGDLHFPATPDLDATWRSSVLQAWRNALLLTDRRDVDGHVSLAGATALAGGSAGLSAGLLALAMLLDRPLPDHFATGTVAAPDGFLLGGMATRTKAQGAEGYARQLGMTRPPFFSPPIDDAPQLEGLDVRLAADVASAYAQLDPEGYARIRARHQSLRAVPDTLARLRDAPLFALVHRPPGGARLPEVADVHVEDDPRADGPGHAMVLVGEKGIVLWRYHAAPGDELATLLPAIVRLAQAHSVR